MRPYTKITLIPCSTTQYEAEVSNVFSSNTKKGMLTRKPSCIVLSVIIACLASFLLTGIIFTKAWAVQTVPSVPIYKYYTSITIEKGDTLWSIAQEQISEECSMNVPEYIEQVKELNHMESDLILEGEQLLIFYYSTEYK